MSRSVASSLEKLDMKALPLSLMTASGSPWCLQTCLRKRCCRWDNNPLYDLSLESSLRAKMRYQNRLKSRLYSIKQNLEIILRRPNTDSQKYPKRRRNYIIKYC